VKLAGKVVLVTGASSGIGEATAVALARRGAVLALVARREDRLNRVAASIRAAGGRAEAYPTDLADPAAVAAMASAVRRDLGVPDVVVNNAGAGRWIPLVETDANEARRMIELPYLAACTSRANSSRRWCGDVPATSST
jgi:short-subunit dehydrogenase